jgi:hypothetical protein
MTQKTNDGNDKTANRNGEILGSLHCATDSGAVRRSV